MNYIKKFITIYMIIWSFDCCISYQ